MIANIFYHFLILYSSEKVQLVKSSVLHWKNIDETYSSWILFLQKRNKIQFGWSLSNVILLLSCNLKKGKEAPERNSSFVKILNQIIFLLSVAFSEIKVGKRSEILKFAKAFFFKLHNHYCHSVSACSTFDRFDAILRKWHLSH